MRKIVVMVGTSVIVLLLLVAAIAVFRAQRADYGWDPAFATPAFTSTHPRVFIDQAHYSASTAGVGGRYWPFARLLGADGYDVQKGTDRFSQGSLDGVQVLVMANAAGAPKPQFLGINIPVRTSKKRDGPAFTAGEIEVVRAWVERGGSLLLIADHAPFGAASEALAASFGVKMYQGFIEGPNEQSDPLLFSKENGRLGDHPSLCGDSPETTVRRVMTFTGQSLDGPAEASVCTGCPIGCKQEDSFVAGAEDRETSSEAARPQAPDDGRQVLGERAAGIRPRGLCGADQGFSCRS